MEETVDYLREKLQDLAEKVGRLEKNVAAMMVGRRVLVSPDWRRDRHYQLFGVVVSVSFDDAVVRTDGGGEIECYHSDLEILS